METLSILSTNTEFDYLRLKLLNQERYLLYLRISQRPFHFFILHPNLAYQYQTQQVDPTNLTSLSMNSAYTLSWDFSIE